MNIFELQEALLPYPGGRELVVLIEGHEERTYSISSVDEIRDEELGKPVVIIACTESK